MRYAFLAVFALIFGGIVYAAQAIDSFVTSEKVCGISQTSCGVSSSATAEKESEMEPGRPPGVPGIAQPKLKGTVRYGTATTSNHVCVCSKCGNRHWCNKCKVVRNQVCTCRCGHRHWTTNNQHYYNGCNQYRNCWSYQPLQPCRNVVRYFHNHRPVRRTLGFLFCGGCR